MAILSHPIAIGLVSGVVIAASDRKRDLALRLGVALPLGVLASKVVKRVHPRWKPRLLTLTPRESMPSGHSVATTAFALGLYDVQRTDYGYGALRWLPVALGAIGFVNACRYHDREHRLSEILVGDAIGLAATVVGSALARR